MHVARRLLEDGDEVLGVDSLNAYYDPALKRARLSVLGEVDGFRFAHVDVADEAVLGETFEGFAPTGVVHLAAQAGVRYSLVAPRTYGRSNLSGFVNVLEECRHRDVRHLVYASSSSVYGVTSRLPFNVADPADHPVSLYAATKRANELMAHSYSHLFGLPTTGLRFFTVYGPWGRPDMAYYAFTEAIFEGRPITVFGDGSAQRDFTYVDDIVEGVVRVARQPAQPDEDWTPDDPHLATSPAPWRVLNIGHGSRATVSELIGLLESALGTEAKIEYEPPQPGDVPVTHADVGDLARLTGFTPGIELEDGLGRFVEWYRAYRGGEG
jgi:UDP-glucuronate 4-epimerase